MSLRYVVVVQADDYHRVYGTFRDRARADALAGKINEQVEAKEDAEFAEWQARPAAESGNTPDGYGRAGVLSVRRPRIRGAVRFALGELDAP